MRGIHPYIYINVYTCVHVKSCDKSKTLYYTIIMPVFTRLIEVVTYYEELSTKYLHDTSMRGGHVRLGYKLNTLYLHL